MKKVLVITITTGKLIDRAYQSILNQDYPNYDVLLSVIKPDEKISVRDNKIKHYEVATKYALASDADYFFWVEDDIVLSKNALSNLMLQLEQPPFDEKMFANLKQQFPTFSSPIKKHIISGWFKIKDEKGNLAEQYNCGRWVADNAIVNMVAVENSVVRVDKIDLGCILISKEAQEKIKWRGEECIINEHSGVCNCLMFSKNAQDAGYELFMDGSVVCEHLIRENKNGHSS